MQTIEMFISNYKKLQEVKTKFETGNLYLVQGKNSVGKTSFINLIEDMFKAKSSTDNSVSFGKEEGEAKMNIINFNNKFGEQCTLKYEYGKDDKFILILPDGSIKKNTTAIREVFKYQEMSVDEFFSLGLTAEGRRKQAKFIKNVFPKDLLTKLEEIEVLVNEKNGTLYKERTTLNSSISALKSLVDSYKLTDDETSYLQKKKQFEDKTEEIKKQYNIVLLKKDKIENSSSKNLIESYNNQISNYNSNIEKALLMIKEYKQKITDLEVVISEDKKNIELLKNKIQECNINNIENLSDEEINFIEKVPEILEKRKQQQLTLDNISIKYSNYVKTYADYEDAINKFERIDSNIKNLRKEKISLLSNAELPIKNITFVDDEIFYVENDNLIPFTEKSLSYSTGGKEIVKLMCEINKDVPIIVIGKTAEYDEKSLDELLLLAQKYDKVLLADYVVPNENFNIVCYQK